VREGADSLHRVRAGSHKVQSGAITSGLQIKLPRSATLGNTVLEKGSGRVRITGKLRLRSASQQNKIAAEPLLEIAHRGGNRWNIVKRAGTNRRLVLIA
jgi:hypothetical protein